MSVSRTADYSLPALSSFPLLGFPPELIVEVAKHLPEKDLSNFLLASKYTHNLASYLFWGPIVARTGPFGGTILHRVLIHGNLTAEHSEDLKHLISKLPNGALEAVSDATERTALHYTSLPFKRNCVAMNRLLEAGADANKKDAYGRTALHYVLNLFHGTSDADDAEMDFQSQKIAPIMGSSGGNRRCLAAVACAFGRGAQQHRALCGAHRPPGSERLWRREFLRFSNREDGDDTIVLPIDYELGRLLISHGADVNCVHTSAGDYQGFTLLHFAVCRRLGHIRRARNAGRPGDPMYLLRIKDPLCQFLLMAGADPLIKDAKGRTPLDLCDSADWWVRRLLLRAMREREKAMAS